MRKIVFTIVGSMLISICAVQAQQSDTTGTAAKSKSKQNRYKTEQSSKDRNKANKDQAWQQQSDRSGADRAVVVIDVQEVPSTVRQKLEADEKYSGWEKATVYHNTRTGDYVFIPQPFRLDKEGNAQEMTGDQAWGYQNNQYGQQGHDMSRQHQDMSQQRKSERDQNQSGTQQGQYRSGSQQDQDQSRSQQDQSGSQRTQDQSRSQQDQDMSAQERAENQMGEIPTSASQDRSDDQQQSTSYRTQESQRDGQQQNSQGYRADENEYNTASMVEVQEDQIPESLRTTLQEREYKGWKESGKLYRNPSTSEYVLIIDKTDNSSQERRYRFDANGERVNE